MKIRGEMSIARLQEEDIDDIISLSRKIGWDYDNYEVYTVLKSGVICGHKYNGDLISCGAIINYDHSISSIGMIIVDPKYQGLGLGKEVTQTCINMCSNNSVMLIATREGKPLYERMGFQKIDYVHKMISEKYTGTKPSLEDFFVESFNSEDIQKIITMDKEAFGGRRFTFFNHRFEQSHKCLIVRNKENEIVGFGLSILGPENLILGPIVAPDSKSANLLVHELSQKYEGRLRIDVPSGQGAFLDFLVKSGFKEVRQPPLMSLNSHSLPERDGKMYGIAAQVFG